MTTKELLLKQIDTLTEKQLQELYQFVQQHLQKQQPANQNEDQPFLLSLAKIQIDAPEDFSENWEKYLEEE